MTRTEFIEEFAKIVEVAPEQLSGTTPLANIEAWDSVSYLSAMVMIDEKLGVTVRPEVLSRSETFGDILSAVQSSFSQ